MKTDQVLFPITLKEASMAFELKDGTFLHIHKDDVQKIATEILIEAITDMGNPNINIVKRYDTNIDRVNKIQEILKTNDDISPESRDLFHKEMLKLISMAGDIRDEVEKFDKKLKP